MQGTGGAAPGVGGVNTATSGTPFDAFDDFNATFIPIQQVVPEPASMTLVVMGSLAGLGVAGMRRLRRRGAEQN